MHSQGPNYLEGAHNKLVKLLLLCLEVINTKTGKHLDSSFPALKKLNGRLDATHLIRLTEEIEPKERSDKRESA